MVSVFRPGPLPETRRSIEVPREAAGYLIGERGFTIKQIQNSTGARVVAPPYNANNSVPCHFWILGNSKAVDLALGELENVIGM